MDPSDTEAPPKPVTDRADPPRGFLNTAWPLVAVGLILLMLLRACAPAASSSPALPPVAIDPGETRPADGNDSEVVRRSESSATR